MTNAQIAALQKMTAPQPLGGRPWTFRVQFRGTRGVRFILRFSLEG